MPLSKKGATTTAPLNLNTNDTNNIHLININGQPHIDSRIIAQHLNIKHKNAYETIVKYTSQLEELGSLPFKTESRKRDTTGGVIEKFALLNEDQCTFVLTLSRNTERVVKLKLNIVKTLKRFKDQQQIQADYLPFYHSLHDCVDDLATKAANKGSSASPKVFHMNFNKMINKAFGLPSGIRAALPAPTKAMVTMGNIVAMKSLERSICAGIDHKKAYQEAKLNVMSFAQSCNATFLERA